MPTGVLALRIHNAPGPPQHGTFRDRATEPLEQRLNGFLARMAESSRTLREQREAAEKERQRQATEERRRQEQERKDEVTRARFRFLEQQARLWHRKQQVLAYVEAVRAELNDAEVTPKERETAERWLEWADEYLKRRNPLGLLRWNPLITREDRLYYRFAWNGGYGEEDEWLETWSG